MMSSVADKHLVGHNDCQDARLVRVTGDIFHGAACHDRYTINGSDTRPANGERGLPEFAISDGGACYGT